MSAEAASSSLLGVYALAARELKRFARQRNRVFGALAQPILFWALFGAGLSPSFRAGGNGAGLSYTEYFFPGTVVLIVLFTAIFATISIIDDRNAGFLQSVLVAPMSTPALVLGKLSGATMLALAQALLFFPFAPLAGVHLTGMTIALAIPLLAVIAFALTGLGFSIAWHMDSTQGFHAIMTAFLMPMWLLSGSFFPAKGVPGVLAWIIAANPLTYGVAAFRRVLYFDRPELVADLPGMAASLAVVALFALAMFAVCWYSVRRTQEPAR